MISKYGTYAFGEGRCNISRSIRNVENDARQVVSQIVRLEVEARLGGTTTAAAMDTAVRNLLTAFESNGKDFVVYLPDGSTASQLSLYSAPAMGGVRVIEGPTLPSLANAAYVTWLPVTFVLEAEYPADNAGGLLLDFEETITFEGGGPQYGWLKPLVGVPQRQLLRQRDTYRATQSGFSIGAFARPLPPNPLWLNALMKNPSAIKRSPKRRGGTYTDFYTAWEYTFESDSPLVGNPNVWS